MLGENLPLVSQLFGIGSDTLSVWQMGARTILTYLLALFLVRFGEKRFIGQYSAVDAVLGFFLGSILSRAITGSSPFFETIAAAFILVVLHKAFAMMAYRNSWFNSLVKGQERQLVQDGEILWDTMQKSHITEDDLHQAMRIQEQLDDLKSVRLATLERSGEISVLETESEPRVIDIQVEKGVQTARLRLE